MVTSFYCSRVDGRGAAQSPNSWKSCKVQGNMREGGMDNRGIVMKVEGAWNLGGMGMLSCMRTGSGVLVCVLVLVVVVLLVMVLVWMWMVLTVCVVVGVLAVLLVMVVPTMVGMLVEVSCMRVVSESSGRGFAVVVVLEDFGVLLWCGSRMAL